VIRSRSKEMGSPYIWAFCIEDFTWEPIFFQREIIRYLYEDAHHGTVWLSRWLIDELIRFVTEGSNSYGIREVKKLSLLRRSKVIYTLSSIG
jgi:hypothetical protein